jgi:hypothetical protein
MITLSKKLNSKVDRTGGLPVFSKTNKSILFTMEQRQVSFNRQIRVRKHIHRSSITEEEMNSTWYTTQELREAKLAVRKHRQRERDESSSQHALLSSAIYTIEQPGGSARFVGSYDSTMNHLHSTTARPRRSSGQLLTRSNSVRGKDRSKSWMSDVTNISELPRPQNRRNLLRKSNSLPALIQELLQRQRSFRSKGRSKRSKSGFVNVKESPTPSDVTNTSELPRPQNRRNLLRKSNSLPALIQDDEEETPLNYELLQRQWSFRSKGRSKRSKYGFANVKGSPTPFTRKSFRALPEPTFIIDEEPPLDYAL